MCKGFVVSKLDPVGSKYWFTYLRQQPAAAI